jgi:GxxExxY protein
VGPAIATNGYNLSLKIFHRKGAKHRKGKRMSSTPQFKKIWEVNPLSKEIVDAAVKVHTRLGPGLLESAYEGCLVQELRLRGLHVQSQLALPVFYEGVKIDVGYRIDLMVEDLIVIEVKSVETLLPVHEAQVITYLKLSGKCLGFLMNFNVRLMREGLRRFATGMPN